MLNESVFTTLIEHYSSMLSNTISILEFFKSKKMIANDKYEENSNNLFNTFFDLLDYYDDTWMESLDDGELVYLDVTPDFIINNRKRLVSYYDFFEEWSEFTDVVGFGTQRATAKEILCQFVKDIAEFFSDFSEEYPSKKYESEI